MQTKDLHAIWNAPDNSRLTAKQYTVRLPIRVAAQLAALSEMYPRKTKTELIGDLLATALDQLAGDLPRTNVGAAPQFTTPDGEEVWNQTGPGVRFEELFKKYLAAFEAEDGHPDHPEVAPQHKRQQSKKPATRKSGNKTYR